MVKTIFLIAFAVTSAGLHSTTGPFRKQAMSETYGTASVATPA